MLTKRTTIIFFIVFLTFAIAEYDYYGQYGENGDEDKMVDDISVADDGKLFVVPRIRDHVIITAEKGDIIELSCNPSDLGGCRERFLKKSDNETDMQVFVELDLRVSVVDEANYTCGCVHNELGTKNITFTVFLTQSSGSGRSAIWRTVSAASSAIKNQFSIILNFMMLFFIVNNSRY